MLILIVLMAAVFFLLTEYGWFKKRYAELRFQSTLSSKLVEPGEPVVLNDEVTNTGKRFSTFVRIIEHMPNQAEIIPDKNIPENLISKFATSFFLNISFNLNPKVKRAFHIRFTLKNRGKHFFATKELCVGDFFGLKEKNHFIKSEDFVAVLPKQIISPENLQILSGFLGEISVKRFIMEDPVLTIGFNDYTGREPMKQISWTRSAVAGELKVRQYDYTVNESTTIVMNLSCGTTDDIESVFSTVRVVAEQLEQRKIPFGLITNTRLEGTADSINSIDEGLGDAHLQTILYSLACAENICYYSFAGLVNNILHKGSRDTTYIVVSAPLSGTEDDAFRVLTSFCNHRVCLLTCRKEDTP